MAKQLQELKLDDAHATAIIELGIEYEAYDSDMPDSKKERLAAANEIVAFCIDAVVTDDMRPDDDDPETAADGAKIAEILALGGIEIDEDNNIEYGELPDLDAEADEEDEDEDAEVDEEEDEDDEAPFDPDDYLDGYTEMRVSEKVKAIKEALDPSDEDDVATLEALVEWENEQDKPSSRVLSLIEDLLGEADEDADEADDDNGDDDEAEAEVVEDEPWEGYDKATAQDIKAILKDKMDDEEDPLTAEQVEYVLEYERNREKPPPRKRIITFCEELLEQFEKGDAADEPEEEAEKPKRGRGLGRGRDKKRDKAAAPSNGTIVLTREDILAALADGKVEIEV